MPNKKQRSGLQELNGACVAPGHCVILNNIEKPWGPQVCVVTGTEGNLYLCKYLCADKQYDCFNAGKGMLVTRTDEITPVNDFGVQILYDSTTNKYWCTVVRESQAKYRDGEKRRWQEHTPRHCTPRKELLKLVLRKTNESVQ